jgi:hypothetical protein
MSRVAAARSLSRPSSTLRSKPVKSSDTDEEHEDDEDDDVVNPLEGLLLLPKDLNEV